LVILIIGYQVLSRLAHRCRKFQTTCHCSIQCPCIRIATPNYPITQFPISFIIFSPRPPPRPSRLSGSVLLRLATAHRRLTTDDPLSACSICSVVIRLPPIFRRPRRTETPKRQNTGRVPPSPGATTGGSVPKSRPWSDPAEAIHPLHLRSSRSSAVEIPSAEPEQPDFRNDHHEIHGTHGNPMVCRQYHVRSPPSFSVAHPAGRSPSRLAEDPHGGPMAHKAGRSPQRLVGGSQSRSISATLGRWIAKLVDLRNAWSVDRKAC